MGTVSATQSHFPQAGIPPKVFLCGHCGRGQFDRGQKTCLVCRWPLAVPPEPLPKCDANRGTKVSYLETGQRTCARLKELRRLLDLSQRELGAAIKCAPCKISKYERGIIMPSLESLDRLAGALHLSLRELLDEESEVKDLALRSLVRSPGTGPLLRELAMAMPRLGQHTRVLILASVRQLPPAC